MERKILHLDLDAFFCSVEELLNPALKGKPFAVGGTPQERGVVASCSYPARQFGVRSAMPMSRAKQLCPALIMVPAKHERYREVSAKVMAILHDLTPLVEQLSIDEAFLDVTDHPDTPNAIAHQLQQRINQNLQLACSLGVASNKLVAKIANNIGKDSVKTGQYPNAVTVIPFGQEKAFLAPLPTRELWGVGPKTEERLAALGIETIGQLAAHPQQDLIWRFGKHGQELWQHAHGLDDRPIVTEYETKSISREATFTRDEARQDILSHHVQDFAEDVAKALVKEGLRGQTVKLKLRWSDFTTFTRQLTLPQPTNSPHLIYTSALRLLEQHRPLDRPVRLIGVGVSALTEQPVLQLGLWETAPAKLTPDPIPPKLESALDHLRQKYGDGAIKRLGDES